MLQPHRSTNRRGFTVVELLVAIAIIGVLIALVLPAIQQAREAARRLACKSNLHNIGLALHNYHGTHAMFPPGAVGPLSDKFPQFAGLKHHGLGTYLLPHLDQAALYSQYRWNASWFDPENQDVVKRQLPVWQCPSAEGGRMKDGKDPTITPPPPEAFIGTAACGDYAGMRCVDAELARLELIDRPSGPRDVLGQLEGIFPMNVTRRLEDIRDSTSCTILMAECAGRPQLFYGREEVSNTWLSGGPWASRNLLWCKGATTDGTKPFGPCAINCTNNREVYSFHSGGANVVLADGTVRFLGESIDIRVFAALVTRAGGEVVGDF